MAHRSILKATVVAIGLSLAIPGEVGAQQGRPVGPEYSILYWYDRTDPERTVKFQVYDNRKTPYRAEAVRGWMAKNRINEPGSKWRASPYDAPYPVYLSGFDRVVNGRMTEQAAVETAQESIRKQLRIMEIRQGLDSRFDAGSKQPLSELAIQRGRQVEQDYLKGQGQYQRGQARVEQQPRWQPEPDGFIQRRQEGDRAAQDLREIEAHTRRMEQQNARDFQQLMLEQQRQSRP